MEEYLQSSITDINNIKINSIIIESIEKLMFLGKINESEDNSSELAGFEINKLLQEQSRLEAKYAELIKERNKLKGISNKDKYLEIQNNINDISKILKESTKKLCRLFKENSNLAEDTLKMRREREDIIETLKDLTDKILDNNFDDFFDRIIIDLESQNELTKNQDIEKDLNKSIKNLKSTILLEKEEFENECKEKILTIQKLKENVSKIKSESEFFYNYQKKELSTNEKTKERILNNKEELVLNETKKYMDLEEQEKKTFAKIEEFMKEEDNELISQKETVLSKSRDLLKEKENEIKHIEFKIQAAELVLTKLKEEYDEEYNNKLNEQNKIKEMLEKKENEKSEGNKLDDNIKIIQYYFEDWYSKIGQFEKKKKK